MPCPACDSSDHTRIQELDIPAIARTIADYVDTAHSYAFILQTLQETMQQHGLATFAINRCDRCGLEFAAPMVLLEDIYAKLYTATSYCDRWEFVESAVILEEMQANALFEIGCGSGKFLSLAHARGLQAAGIDLSPTAVELAQQQGLSVFLGGLDTTSTYIKRCFAGEKVDAIALFQVFEHLDDPLALLQFAAEYLRESGILLLSVPSWKRPQRRLGILEEYDYPPHHLTRWNEPAFTAIAARAGYRVVRFLYESLSEQQLKKQLARRTVYTSPFYKTWKERLRIPVVVRTDTSLLHQAAIRLRQLAVAFHLSRLSPSSLPPLEDFSGESMLVVLQR